MNQLLLMRLLPYAAGLLFLVGGVAAIHHHGTVGGRDEIQAKWDKEKAAQMAAHLQAVVANEKLKRQLKDTENVNTIEINRLRDNNHALWLRLPKTACNPTGTATGSDSIAASGIVSTTSETGQDETNGGLAQQGFDEYERGRNDEAYRADSIVEGCRVHNDWINNFKAAPF